MTSSIILTLFGSLQCNLYLITIDTIQRNFWIFNIFYIPRTLTTMHTEITVILIENLECGDVGRTENHLVHPFDALDHLYALLLGEDRRALVFGDFLVGVYTHNYLIAKCFGLSKRIGMPEVYHVVAIENDTKRRERRKENFGLI